MKKVLLLIVTAVLLVVTLTACQSKKTLSQSLLRQWESEQVLSYDVFDGGTDGKPIGKMTLTMQYLKGATVYVGAKEVKNFKGNRFTYKVDMTFDGAAIVIESEVLTGGDGGFVPKYSYKKVTKNETLVFEINAEYGKKTYDYTLSKDGNSPKNGSVKLSGTYFDNEMIFGLMRAASLDSIDSSVSYSFTVPSVLDDKTKLLDMMLEGKKETYDPSKIGDLLYYFDKSKSDTDGFVDADEADGGNKIPITSAVGFAYYLKNTSKEYEESSVTVTHFVKTDRFSVGDTYLPVYIKQGKLTFVLYSAA
ncbi:MAG: hypothetical protein LBT20_02200 [Clostridiales bacterium]|nr:hypothetical protein [Clostridiales bacterium]